jgi:hypothetical protein
MNMTQAEEAAPDTERMKLPPLRPNIAFHDFKRVVWNCWEARAKGQPLPVFGDERKRELVEQMLRAFDEWRALE